MTPKVAFLGGDAFAVPALRAIADHVGLDLVFVGCPHERPSGRGMKRKASPVAVGSGEIGMDCMRVDEDGAIAKAVKESGADFCVVCAFGVKLGPRALAAPRRCCVNIHASLLPRWRGAAPVERAILAGERRTGITTIRMSERIDAGEILLQEDTEIGGSETAGELRDRLAVIGASLVVSTILGYGEITPRTQDKSQVTRAPKLRKEEARIDWREGADTICAKVRAFNPRPGAHCVAFEDRLKVLRASPFDGGGEPGTVVSTEETGLAVACADGAVLLEEVLPAGGKRMDAPAWLRGLRPRPAAGQSLESPGGS